MCNIIIHELKNNSYHAKAVGVCGDAEATVLEEVAGQVGTGSIDGTCGHHVGSEMSEVTRVGTTIGLSCLAKVGQLSLHALIQQNVGTENKQGMLL